MASVDIGSIQALLRLYRLARQMYSKQTPRNFKNRALVLGVGISHLSELRAWYSISDNPRLSSALARFPQMHGAIYWPYINNTWSMTRRLTTIDQHYRLLDGRAAIIAQASKEEVELASLDPEYAGLRLVLDKAIWFLREGEVVLNLFLRDQRLYSIAFTLGSEADLLVVYVGALQGSNVEAVRGLYRDITHALHGMRPRDFLLAALRFLVGHLGAAKIYAVADDARQHRSTYFGDSHKDKLLLDYDEVWSEHGGTRRDDGFFEIPVLVKYREADQIPTRKRASYRRRYQMLDKLALEIGAHCSLHDTTQAEEP